MTKREKTVVLSGVAREQMEEAFGAYTTAAAESAKITARLEAAIAKLRVAANNDLAEQTAKQEEAYAVIQAFAMEHRADLFAKTKSLRTIHGVLGFRKGMPQLSLRKGVKWAKVIALLKDHAPEYVKITEVVAKDKLLADRDTERIAGLLPTLGVDVVQKETFFVEPTPSRRPKNSV